MIVLLVYIWCLDDSGTQKVLDGVLAAPALLSVASFGWRSLEPSSPDTQALDSWYLITFTYCGVIAA